MARIVTQELNVKISKVVKNTDSDHPTGYAKFVDDTTIDTLETAIEQLVDDDSTVVEVFNKMDSMSEDE